MPIASYIAYPKPGKGRALARTLASLPGREVTLSVGHDLLVLVTDTPDEATEGSLQHSLRIQPDLDGLALVSRSAP